MAVRIRLKKLGRRHRPYYRICVMDARTPRDGKSIEEVGTYDPMIPDTDKRVTMKGDRIDYWLSVGAQPTEKVKILIDKYKGKVPEVRIDERKVRTIPEPPPPTASKPKKTEESAKDIQEEEVEEVAPVAAEAETPAEQEVSAEQESLAEQEASVEQESSDQEDASAKDESVE